MTASCDTSGRYYLQFTNVANNTSVWVDDSIAGMSYDHQASSPAVLTFINPGTGDRHVELRAANDAAGATFDMFHG